MRIVGLSNGLNGILRDRTLAVKMVALKMQEAA